MLFKQFPAKLIKLTIIVGVTLLSITSCGFHLRGAHSGALSSKLKRPYLETSAPFGPLAHALERAFKRANATTVKSAHKSSVILAILDEKKSQNLLSVGATQSSRQYKLTLSITFALKSNKGTSLTNPKTFKQSRILTMSSNLILSSSNEVENIYQQMRLNLANDIINYLASHKISAILDK